MKKLLFLLILIALGGAAGYYGWRAGAAGPPGFSTVPVARGDLLLAVSATGSVEPVEIIDVGAQIIGRIKSFGPDPKQPGKTIDYRSHVHEGDILAQLDDLPHKAELKRAVANQRVAEGELTRCRARLRQAERVFRRAEKLRDTNAVSDFENATADYEIAQAEVAAGEAKVEQAKVLAEQAQINLGYTTIRSPVDGVVIDRRVNVGQTVVAGLNAPSLFLMAKDLSKMHVWAAVNEADIGDIRVGQAVTFKVDAYGDRVYSGKVTQIRLNASMVQNVVTYGVVVEVDNLDGSLLPYMTAKLQFEVARRSKVLLVPNQALRWQPRWEEVSPSVRDDLRARQAAAPVGNHEEEIDDEATEEKVDLGTPTLWVLADDGFARPVKVQTGLSDGLSTEVSGSELAEAVHVVLKVVREAQPDFVSSFISKVVNTKK